MLNLDAIEVKHGASRQRTDLDSYFDLLNRVLSKVPNSDDETRMVRMAGDYGSLERTN
jgi:hypothetical protein